MRFIFPILILLLSGCKANISTLERIEKYSNQDDCFECIRTLAESTPARMSGSNANSEAIAFLQKEMEKTGAKVTIDSVEVPYWLPGESHLSFKDGNSITELNTIPLGLSIGTDGKVLNLKIVEFKNKADFEKATSLEGCAVFFNEKMDTTANGYSKAGWQRMFGASMAARKGAEAVITRSLSPVSDNFPRTGTLRYEEGTEKIPAVAISTNDADLLSKKIAENPDMRINLSSTSEMKGTATGFNLIGEIKGSKNPETVILITAHIDSWFNSQGAQDNATGCAQAIDVLRVFSKAGIKPLNTIRVLIYQDEEISMAGMKRYIERYGNEKHLFDLEIDSGAEEPIGFTLFETEPAFNKIKTLAGNQLPTVDFQRIPSEAASFWPLYSEKKIPVYFYTAERKDYFSIHHSEVDNMSLIDKDIIRRSSAMIASFIYVADKITDSERAKN